MKKYLFLLLCAFFLGSTLNSEVAQATDEIGRTDLGITFAAEPSILPKPPIVKDPIVPIEGIKSKPIGRLPSTGDLITSLIWTLLGFSLLIVFVGVYSLKNIMLKLS